jgi:hypothetical protein
VDDSAAAEGARSADAALAVGVVEVADVLLGVRPALVACSGPNSRPACAAMPIVDRAAGAPPAAGVLDRSVRRSRAPARLAALASDARVDRLA